MLKILLVDDEFYFRQYLKTCINWEKLGCEIAGEATDGDEGLHLAEKLCPEIIFLDINMPCLDGIEFCKRFSRKHPECKIVILSGHNEFQYAQQAIKYGVKSYILKPLDEKELSQTIEELKLEIQGQKRYKSQIERLEKKQNAFLEEKYLDLLIRGIPFAKEEEIPFAEEDYYMILALEIDETNKKQWGKEERELWYYAVKNVTVELLPDSVKAYFGKDHDGRILCLIQSEKPMENLLKRMNICAAKITDFAASHFPFILTAGFSANGKGYSGIEKSYRQAVFSLRNKYINRESRVLDYERAKSEVCQNTFLKLDQRRQILMYLRQGDREAFEILRAHVFENARIHRMSYDMLQCHCTEFIFLCCEYLEEKDASFEEVFPDISFPLYVLDAIHNIEEAETVVQEFYSRVFSFMEKKYNYRGSRQISDIKLYVEEHFQEPEFKIGNIAEKFSLNYHYLCHYFKQQTGMTLNQYINWVRVERAKELMNQGYCNLTMLAEKVGYSDLGYFGKCFKKQTGISPSRYLDKISEETPHKITNEPTNFTNKLC